MIESLIATVLPASVGAVVGLRLARRVAAPPVG
jgi:hypothetical protein